MRNDVSKATNGFTMKIVFVLMCNNNIQYCTNFKPNRLTGCKVCQYCMKKKSKKVTLFWIKMVSLIKEVFKSC